MGTKNANGYVGERRRLVKMLRITKMGVLFEKSKRSGEKRNASPHLTASELYFELFFKKTDKIVFERRILSFSAGGENFPLNPDGFCSVHKMVCLAFSGRKTAAISRVAKQTILMRRAQKNEQERQPIFVITNKTYYVLKLNSTPKEI